MSSVSVWHCVLAPFLVHRDRIPDGSQVGEEGFAVAPQGRHGGIPGRAASKEVPWGLADQAAEILGPREKGSRFYLQAHPYLS